MNQLATLLRWDLLHLQRHQMITITLAVGTVYLGLFYLLRSLGNLDRILIVMIFNDPILMSYLFAGVLTLFERDQHTQEALLVAPVPWGAYLWSRALSLSLIATLVSLFITWVGYGLVFDYVPFVVGCFGTSLLFVWIGCWVGHRSDGFNTYLIRSVALFLPIALPMLSLFEVWDSPLLYLLPSCPGFLLLEASFGSIESWQYLYSYAYLLLATVGAFYLCRRTFAPV